MGLARAAGSGVKMPWRMACDRPHARQQANGRMSGPRELQRKNWAMQRRQVWDC